MRLFRKEATNITEGVIWKQLLVFFFPILFGTFFQQLYNTVDAIIVGNFVGKEALAAVGGTTGTLVNLLVNLFVGVSSGATVVISQYFGAQRYDDVRKAVSTSVALALYAGVAMTAIGLVISPWALRAMDTPPEIMDYALTYLRIYFLGMIASFLYNIGSGILRAIGDTRRPLYFLIVACLTNIVLDLLFVVVFQWKVMGVAIATVLSQVVSAALVVSTLLRTDGPYHLDYKHIRITPAILKDIVRIGLPAGIQSDMYTFSNILIQTRINLFGTNTIAAWTAFGKIDSFFWMIMSAYGVAITAFVGQNFGAQKYERVRKSVRVCLQMSFGTAIFFSFLLCLCNGPLYRLFTQDAEVIAIGSQMVWYMIPFYATYVCVEILSGAIRGTGDAILPMILTVMGVCVLRIAWVLVFLPLRPELTTILVSYPITWSATSLLFILYYFFGGWMKRRIDKCGFSPEVRVPRRKTAQS